MGIILNILYIVVLIVIGLALAPICIDKVFSKVRISKWIPLAGSIIILVAQWFIKTNMIINGILTLVCVLLFIWFMDIHQTGGPKQKEKPIVIKPKAKPNRVKNMQKNNNK